MLIVCPSCATSYDVEVASLRPNGRQVRCVRCRTTWQAELSHSDKLMAAVEAIAPVRRAVEAVAEAVAGEPDSQAPAVVSVMPERGEAERPAEKTFLAAPPADIEPQPVAALSAEAQPNDTVEVDAPPIVPVDLDEVRTPVEVDAVRDSGQHAEPIEDIETIAARRHARNARRGRLSWPLTRLQSGVLALVLIDSILVGWRADFVRVLPQTASFYARLGLPVNLRGLDFEKITTSTEQHENVPVLSVEGNIVNDGARTVDVPRLKFAVRNAARQEIYSWTAAPPRATLPPGEIASFSTRLASPPPDAHDVLVRFVSRYDILPGSR